MRDASGAKLLLHQCGSWVCTTAVLADQHTTGATDRPTSTTAGNVICKFRIITHSSQATSLMSRCNMLLPSDGNALLLLWACLHAAARTHVQQCANALR